MYSITTLGYIYSILFQCCNLTGCTDSLQALMWSEWCFSPMHVGREKYVGGCATVSFNIKQVFEVEGEKHHFPPPLPTPPPSSSPFYEEFFFEPLSKMAPLQWCFHQHPTATVTHK